MQHSRLALCASFVLLASAYSIAQAPTYSFGGASGDAAGTSVALAGDVNGDGFDDIVVGAPFGDSVIPNIGHAHVFSGADGSEIHVFQGLAADDEFGASVAGAGDVNGDGFADVIIGAPAADPNGASSGQATVFSGANGAVLYTFHGAAAGDALGTSVASAGDYDGDGYADLIVGVPNDSTNGAGAGAARVFSGRNGSILLYQKGATAGDHMGTSVASAGDTNGDCFDDVVIGSPDASYNGANSGRVHIISGGAAKIILWLANGSTGDNFGFSVGGAGDVNADGNDDVIVGSPAASYNGAAAGRVRVYSGISGLAIHTLEGNAAGDQFGWSVSGAGDVDADGIADFAAGSPSASSPQTGSGRAQVFSGADARVLRTIKGAAMQDQTGYSVSGGGDINGDGYADLAVGAPSVDGNGPDSGSAMVFALAPFDTYEDTEHEGDADDDAFGHTVSGAGDVDNDGVPDYIIAATEGATGGYVRIFSGADDSVIRTIAGIEAGEEFGHGAAGVGDLNGDGYGEIVVGAAHHSAVIVNGGRATVYSGIDGSMMYEWKTPNISAAHIGFSVAGAGDVNNDGTPDVLVGILAANANRSGQVRVWNGATGFLLRVWDGAGQDDFMGRAVAGAGDINGDGYDDIIAGATQNNPTGIPGPGYVRVFSGKTASVLYTFSGTEVGSLFGAAVSAGDVDNDGVPDVIVGVPHAEESFDHAGQVKVYSGADGTELYSIDGFAEDDGLGHSVAFAGDVNGDGFGDFAAGAPQEGNPLATGEVHVFSGADGSILATLHGHHAASEFGHAVAGVGDTNGDNHGELVVGAPHDEDGGGDHTGVGRLYASEVKTDPGIFRTYGGACTVSSGSLPRVGTSGRPVLGLTFDVELSSSQPSTSVLSVFGTVQATIPFGFPADGCKLLMVPVTSVLGVADLQGKASTGSLLVPVLPVLVGQSLSVQWLVFDATANPAGIAASNAVRITIGQ